MRERLQSLFYDPRLFDQVIKQGPEAIHGSDSINQNNQWHWHIKAQ
ncbi:hypothetical protein [uncultured Oscillibacter sp.]|nr:hypothetical protein [uncultured Oscillibacter sp.]